MKLLSLILLALFISCGGTVGVPTPRCQQWCYKVVDCQKKLNPQMPHEIASAVRNTDFCDVLCEEFYPRTCDVREREYAPLWNEWIKN